jgi:hypothetical protein
MKSKLQENGLSLSKLILTAVICVFGLLSLIYVRCTTNATFSYFYCLATVPFALLPLFLSVLFRWKIHFLFYAFFSAYTLGPILGAVYNIYYYTTWWDDLLHIMAGTVFAVVGAYIAVAMNKNQKTSPMLSALFGILFSMGVALVWEFFEFSSDVLLNSDMQADTIINTVITKINITDGSVRVFENVTDTAINGQSLGINGYLDIGLFDTMNDMFVETMGALVYFIYAVIDRGRHPLIERYQRNK